METLTLLDMRGEFGCDRILARFLEQDLKFESFGNLGLIYTLVATLWHTEQHHTRSQGEVQQSFCSIGGSKLSCQG